MKFRVLQQNLRKMLLQRPVRFSCSTRHYNALMPYREGELNIYGVLENGTCAVRYVGVAGNHLILRPHNQSCPTKTLPIAGTTSASDGIVGGICFVGMEA